MGIAKEWIGKRVGRLIVKELVGKAKDRHLIYRCVCDCGEEVDVTSNHLRSGHTQSCGCYQKDKVTKHGCARDKLHSNSYETWIHMKNRCKNPNNKNYHNYGGRGISVCDEWDRSFEVFLKDMGERPDGLTLERINNNKDYEPGNCKWITQKEQTRNTRKNRQITFNGEIKTLPVWADELGFKPHVIYSRLFALNWSVADSLTRPVKQQGATR
jgi:hypothetical protein